jgi:UDP-2-acetamido-2,6-beta-L-arabino-hexul-4-ose reductase
VTRILITGGRGFLGRSLAAHLCGREDCETRIFGREDSPADLAAGAAWADIVFHFAGVNRPQDPAEFARVNQGLTEQLCSMLRTAGRAPKIVFSSSIQAGFGAGAWAANAYGASKADAERVLREFAAESGACVRIYRLKNLFGKGARPHYNSVTATFCHHIARHLPIEISDPARTLELTYVDDVIAAFMAEIGGSQPGGMAGRELASHSITLGELAARIEGLHAMGRTLMLPDFSLPFNRALYATYLSHVPAEGRRHALQTRSDARGTLAEFLKQPGLGQIFVSTTAPGITRGNHYHHSKAEKFLVLAGEGLIRMQPIEGGAVDEYHVAGDRLEVIDIPPGFTHSITNTGAAEMVTLFWADEIFDPERPDTHGLGAGAVAEAAVNTVHQSRPDLVESA